MDNAGEFFDDLPLLPLLRFATILSYGKLRRRSIAAIHFYTLIG
jgi:hypothetical protein